MLPNEQVNSNAQQSKGLISAQRARLQALKNKHMDISNKIEKEVSNKFYSEGLISQLKKEKLLLKEEIELLKKVS